MSDDTTDKPYEVGVWQATPEHAIPARPIRQSERATQGQVQYGDDNSPQLGGEGRN